MLDTFLFDEPVDPADLHETLIDAHFDGIWIASQLFDAESLGKQVQQLTFFDLRSGHLLVDDKLDLALENLGAQLHVHIEGSFARYTARLSDKNPIERSGRHAEDGFAQTFERQTGLRWSPIVALQEQTAPASADESHHALVLLRGRFTVVPHGMPFWPPLFFFHHRDALADLAQAGAKTSASDEHLAFVAFDRQQLDHLCRLPIGDLRRFVKAIGGEGGPLLGPHVNALQTVVEFLDSCNADQALADVANVDPLIYEVLALCCSGAYVSGETIDYVDQSFFPLLALSDTPIDRAVVAPNLEDIDQAPALCAAAEVLPYTAPEGQLLDSFADDELTTLCPWAVDADGGYEGSLFLLDIDRFAERFIGFDADTMLKRVERFVEVWQELLDQPARALYRFTRGGRSGRAAAL